MSDIACTDEDEHATPCSKVELSEPLMVEHDGEQTHAEIRMDGDGGLARAHYYESNLIHCGNANGAQSSPSKAAKPPPPPEDANETYCETDLLLTANGAFGANGLLLPKSEPHVQFNNRHFKHVADPGGECQLRTEENLCRSSESTSSSESSIEMAETRAPDGGWGWMVVLASFIVNLIADGITLSFGVIFVEFKTYFGENRGKTAWIGSVFMAMPLLSGPIASFLTDRYGCRRVTIIGSIMASAGFVISSRADSMEILFVTFGMLAGFGLSLCYVASVVIVAYYFEKKRSFATGLSVCGSGIGTFIFAPLTQVLITEYGWRGTTLILAGLFLNLAVCGSLMRDLPWTPSHKAKRQRKRERELKKSRKAASAETLSGSSSTNTNSALQPIIEAQESIEQASADTGDPKLSASLVNLPTFVRNGERVPIEVIELLSTHPNVYNVLMQNYPNLLTPSRSFSDAGRLNEAMHQHNVRFSQPQSPLPAESPCYGGQTSSATHRIRTTDVAYLWWLKRNQITPPRSNPQKKTTPTTAYLKDLRVHRLSLTYRGAMLNINRYRLRASSCPDIYRNSITTIAKEKNELQTVFKEFRQLIVNMFDFSHFADPKFLLFTLSNFLLYTWYDVPYVYIADYAIELGFDEEDSSMLIGLIGIVNTFGEVFLGWAGDRPSINASYIYAVCMTLCGTVIALVPFFKSYWTLATISGLFGLFIAANYSLTCIILVELITLEKFTNAYGLLLLVQGIANLIGPPLGGWLCDITGNYDLSFYLAGIFITISGVILIILPAANRYKNLQNLQRNLSAKPKFYQVLVSCITRRNDVKSTLENHV